MNEALRDAVPVASVVVAAYNEERDIADCLDSLLAQTVPIELVLVDDGSTDRTAAIASDRGIRVLYTAHGGPAVARNAGAAETSAAVLLFLDADMIFAPDFVSRLVAPIADRGVVGTFTRDEMVANPENHWVRWGSGYLGTDPERRMPADHGEQSQVFRAIQREAFDQVGGYDDTGVGEDVTISNKLGRMAERAPGALCFHRNPDTARAVFLAARWYGKGRSRPASIGAWARDALMLAVRPFVRGLRQRSLGVVAFGAVHELGTLAGIVAAHVLKQHHAR